MDEEERTIRALLSPGRGDRTLRLPGRSAARSTPLRPALAALIVAAPLLVLGSYAHGAIAGPAHAGLLDSFPLLALGVGLLSAALALALAARLPLEGYLLARQYARVLRPGDRVVLGDDATRGVVLRHTPVGMVLAADGRERVVAYALLASQSISVDPLGPIPSLSA